MSILPRILIVAGSDSGGGAGIQADLKTVMAHAGYAGTAITALTAQNTQGVAATYPVPPEFVSQQMKLFMNDIGVDAIKTGMLFSAEIIEAVVDTIKQEASNIPLVVDPVHIAKGGTRLLKTEAEETLKSQLIPLATVLTPNIPEAEALCSREIKDIEGMKEAARQLCEMGASSVLIKGGHLKGEKLVDLLLHGGEFHIYEQPRIHSNHTHGTGCTMASAIATLLAKGVLLPQAVAGAQTYVREAIKTAPGLGKGHGPLNHSVK